MFIAQITKIIGGTGEIPNSRLMGCFDADDTPAQAGVTGATAGDELGHGALDGVFVDVSHHRPSSCAAPPATRGKGAMEAIGARRSPRRATGTARWAGAEPPPPVYALCVEMRY